MASEKTRPAKKRGRARKGKDDRRASPAAIRLFHEAEAGASGACAGAVLAASAGPAAAVAGAIVGGVAGALAGAALDRNRATYEAKAETERRKKEDE